jgi:isopenicillin N synthase-like dioxygenase
MAIPVSRRLDFAEIPVIDLSEISASRQNVSTVDAIRMACTEVGFFTLPITVWLPI